MSWAQVEPEMLTERWTLEAERRQRHHDVLCLVLKELVRDDRAKGLDMLPAPTVDIARVFADLAYPPPKAEAK